MYLPDAVALNYVRLVRLGSSSWTEGKALFPEGLELREARPQFVHQLLEATSRCRLFCRLPGDAWLVLETSFASWLSHTRREPLWQSS